MSAERIEFQGEACALQIGLDITERKRSESALRESEQRFRLAVSTGDVWDANIQTGEGRFSARFYQVLGYDEREIENTAAGLESLMHPDDRPRWKQALGDHLKRRLPYQLEFRARAKSGDYHWFSTRGQAVWDDTGRAIYMAGTTFDITERRRAEEALRASEERLRLFVEHAPAAIAMFDKDMHYLSHSRRWCADYRLGDQAVVGRSHYDVFPDLPERWKEVHRRCLAGAIEHGDDDPFQRADGATDWVRWEAHPWRTGAGDIGGIIIFSEVITERVQAEAERREHRARLEAVTRRLLKVQEAERRAIARELHDEVGGVLTAVKLNLLSLRGGRSAATGEAALADGLALVDGAIQSVRSISIDLRPTVLDDLGLIPALKWYCERQAQRSGTPIALAFDAVDLKRAPQLESACFRIAQESITNALRHAGAHRIQVALRRGDAGIELEIADDGTGFDAGAARRAGNAGEHSGLLGMEERTMLLGGRFAIDTAPGGGTRVRAEFPLPEGGLG
jgi:PAS domain S-box-containing protein